MLQRQIIVALALLQGKMVLCWLRKKWECCHQRRANFSKNPNRLLGSEILGPVSGVPSCGIVMKSLEVVYEDRVNPSSMPTNVPDHVCYVLSSVYCVHDSA